MEIKRNCKHELNVFGECRYCLSRIKDPCENKEHIWIKELDTDDFCDFCCSNCGRWKDEYEKT